MKNFILLSIFLFSLQNLSALTIKGIVKDSKTGEEIIGATIFLKELPSHGTTSGLDGSFTLNPKEFPITLVFSYMGYKVDEITIDHTNSGLVTVMLEPASINLQEATVIGDTKGRSDNSARNIEKNSTNILNIVSAKAIELSPDLSVANVIRRVSGVTVERDHTGDGQYAILRGMDKRYNYTLVNGVKIPSPDNKNRFVPLDIFPAELLDRLEVAKALTADMEGDGIGGAVNMVMKDAPAERLLTVNAATGYSALFFNRDFYSFDQSGINKKSPYESYGDGYAAKIRDFTTGNLKLQSQNAKPNFFAGFSYGDRLLKERLGIMLAGSFQNSYRGSNSSYFESATATSDASNLPVLANKNDRTYSEQQTRYGLHAKFDYLFSANHKLQWYNAYMDFSNSQVRDSRKTDLNIGYDPSQGNYNLSFDTRMRRSHQYILNSTLKGAHKFLAGALQANWSAVYSKAFHERPDNASVHTVTTVRNHQENPVSVVTLGGADRRWEHNSDEDMAGYLNLSYRLEAAGTGYDFSAGGMYRGKERSNFFNQYDFRPYDASKPEGTRTNLIRGTDWESYDQIKFNVFNPFGAMGNPLNYDASEDIAAGYGQVRISRENWEAIAGLRAEHTDQGYDLKYPTEGVRNEGSQIYTDYLPSVHVKYGVHTNGNLKASYFKSINRPSFFEIVPYRIINEEYVEMGNPDLRHTKAHNIDLRYEYFPRGSEQFMAGVFYKKLKDPIEFGMQAQGQGTFFTPTNFGDAVNYGVEIDITKYFRWLGFKANYTFTQSNITTTKLVNYDNPDASASNRIITQNVDQTRPLNGQAAHVANLSLLYKNIPGKWDGQLALSYTGERLYAVSRYLDNDIWEGSYFQMDASVEKGFKIGISVYAKASNLLNTPMVQFLKKQNPANEAVEGYENYRGGTLVKKDFYGQVFQIGVKYKF